MQHEAELLAACAEGSLPVAGKVLSPGLGVRRDRGEEKQRSGDDPALHELLPSSLVPHSAKRTLWLPFHCFGFGASGESSLVRFRIRARLGPSPWVQSPLIASRFLLALPEKMVLICFVAILIDEPLRVTEVAGHPLMFASGRSSVAVRPSAVFLMWKVT